MSMHRKIHIAADFFHRRYRLLHCIWIAWLVPASMALAQPDDNAFLRFVEGDREWEGRLQSAIVSYESDRGDQLDLVAAVHIGETEYYRHLNDYFRGRDAVLYELVAEPEDRPVPGQPIPTSPLSFLQRMMAAFLDVSFQLEQIDYSAAGFRHADMNPAQLQAVMAAKNESFVTIFVNLAMAQLAAEQRARAVADGDAGLTTWSLLDALTADNQAQAFKYLFARELGRVGGLTLPPELEQELTIVGDRNDVALDVLRQTLAEGSAKSISLFYGAAHMPGLARAVRDDLGFTRTGVTWIDAWIIP